MNTDGFVNKYIRNESLFRILYASSMLLSFVCIIEIPFQIATYILMLWSVFLIINKFKTGVLKNIKYVELLFLFLSSMLVTTFLNITSHFFMNVLIFYHVAICFFIFYGMHAEQNKTKLKKEMLTFFCLVIRISTILSLLGMIITVFWPQTEILGYRLGLIDNRYTGVYTNPNLSAFMSVVGIIFCHIIFNYNLTYKNFGKTKGTILKNKFLLFSAIVNYITLLLSDSNASLLFILLYLLIFSLCYNLKLTYRKNKKNRILNLILITIICLLIGICVIFMRIGIQNSVAWFINVIHSVEYSPTTADLQNIDNVISLGRNNTEYEISSGRIDSIQKSISLLSYKPIWGVGKENIIKFGADYLQEGFLFFDLHNGYLSILVAYGIVGAFIFIFIAYHISRDHFYALSRFINKGEGTNFTSMFSCLIAYCAYSFFERALLLNISFMVIFFWMLLGYTTTYVVHTNKIKVKVNDNKIQIPVGI